MKSKLSFILALSMLSGLLFLSGCAGHGKGDVTTPYAVTDGANDPDGTGGKAKEQMLGFASEDNGGMKFVILQNNASDLPEDLYAETTNGNRLNDATYARLLAAEEYLGIKFEFQ